MLPHSSTIDRPGIRAVLPLMLRDDRPPKVEQTGMNLWGSLMNAFPSSFSESRRELLIGSFMGVVPPACDAEAGEPEEVLLDRTASPHAAPAAAGHEFSVRI